MSEKTKVEDINRNIYDIKNAYQDKKGENRKMILPCNYLI